MFELIRNRYGQLSLRIGGEFVTVEPKRCFPWTKPESWISLRNSEGDEVGFIPHLSQLSEESALNVRKWFSENGSVIEILEVVDVQEEYELRQWTVNTTIGKRVFQTKLDEFPETVPGGGIVMEDLFGEVYCIANLDNLDEASRHRLWAYVD